MLGRTDDAPTAAGIARCVEQVSDIEIAAIVASDLQRARRAGEAIAAAHGLALRVDPRWRELDFGDWDGLPASAIDRQALGDFWHDPDAFPPPNGERWGAMRARVGAAIGALAPRPTLVVTHGGAMRAALAVLCGFELRQLWAFDLSCASLLSLKLWPGETPSAQIVGLWP